MSQNFEKIFLPSTPTIPNSILPVVIYRDVLRDPTDRDGVVAHVSGNEWRVDGFFGPFSLRHYHSTSHECYALVTGTARWLLGRGELDDDSYGQEVHLKTGDVMILPAGTSHSNIAASNDLKYCASYPVNGEHWDVQTGKVEDVKQLDVLKKRTQDVPLPRADPIFGPHGPLTRLWWGVKAFSIGS